jgi:hypothetical protein
MFALTAADLQGNILGVADGPASFNAELTALGGQVTSVDPIYAFDTDGIQQRFDAVVDGIIEQVRQTPGNWVWSYHQSPDNLRANRVRTMQVFADDYRRNDLDLAPGGQRTAGRYVVGELPRLNFADRQFDLALCSHFLFLYSDQLTYDLHRASVFELLRVAREVRIFPLLTLKQVRSPHLEPLQAELAAQGFAVRVERVPYELQRGGNEMLVVLDH